jgi:hypothetical protein
MPADFSGHFAFELYTALYLQISREGFEGFSLYAELRSAGNGYQKWFGSPTWTRTRDLRINRNPGSSKTQ